MLLLALFTLFSAAVATRNGLLPRSPSHHGCGDGKAPWRHVQYDVLVLGGGPAGLQSTMSLARLGRKVLLVDNQQYRNEATLEMHDVPALDGTSPPDFRAAARRDLKAYPSISYSDATIKRFQNVNNGTYFVAHGSNGQKYTARKIVLASGMTDELPKLKGIGQVWGTGAFWCPWCDGWEHRNGDLGVLTTADLDDAVYVHLLNSKTTTILTDGERISASALDREFWPGVLKSAKAVGISWDYRKLASVNLIDPRSRKSGVRVRFVDGTHRDFKGLLIKTVRRIRSETVLDTLGIKYRQSDADHRFIDTQDRFGRAAGVFGVFAAGDNMQENQSVATALRAGKLTGIAAVGDLGKEESFAAAGWDWRGIDGQC